MQNETLNEELKKFLLDTLKQGKEFVSAEAPDVYKQTLSSHYAVCVAEAFSSSAALVASVCITLLCYSNAEITQGGYRTEWNDWQYAFVWSIPVDAILGIVLLFLLPQVFVRMYNIRNNPKAYLVDYFT